MTSRRRPAWDSEPLWMTRPELRPLAQQLAHAANRELIYLEQWDTIGIVADRMKVEGQIHAVLAAGWHPPITAAGTAGTVDELEALPPGTVVTDPDGHPWVRNRVGEWCEPYPAGIDPAELLADGPVTVHHAPTAGEPLTMTSAVDTAGAQR